MKNKVKKGVQVKFPVLLRKLLLLLGALIASPLLFAPEGEAYHEAVPETHEPQGEAEARANEERQAELEKEQQEAERKEQEALEEKERAEREVQEKERDLREVIDDPNATAQERQQAQEAHEAAQREKELAEQSYQQAQAEAEESARSFERFKARAQEAAQSGQTTVEAQHETLQEQMAEMEKTKTDSRKLISDVLDLLHQDASATAKTNSLDMTGMINELGKAATIRAKLERELVEVVSGTQGEADLFVRIAEVKSVETLWRSKMLDRVEQTMAKMLDPVGYGKGVDVFDGPGKAPSFLERKFGVSKVSELFKSPPTEGQYQKVANELGKYSDQLASLVATDPSVAQSETFQAVKELVRDLEVIALRGAKGKGEKPTKFDAEGDLDLIIQPGSPAQVMKNRLVRELHKVTAEVRNEATTLYRKAAAEKAAGSSGKDYEQLQILSVDLGRTATRLEMRGTEHHRVTRADAKRTRQEADNAILNVDKMISKGDLEGAQTELTNAQQAIDEQISLLEQAYEEFNHRINKTSEQKAAQEKIQKEISKLSRRKVDVDLRVQELDLNKTVSDATNSGKGQTTRSLLRRVFERTVAKINDLLVDFNITKISGASAPEKQAQSLEVGMRELTKTQMVGRDAVPTRIVERVQAFEARRDKVANKVEALQSRFAAEGELTEAMQNQYLGEIRAIRSSQEMMDAVQSASVMHEQALKLEQLAERVVDFTSNGDMVTRLKNDLAPFTPEGAPINVPKIKEILQVEDTRATNITGKDSVDIGLSMIERDGTFLIELGAVKLEKQAGVSEGTTEEDFESVGELSDLSAVITAAEGGAQKQEGISILNKLQDKMHDSGSGPLEFTQAEKDEGLEKLYNHAKELGQTTLTNLRTKEYTKWTKEEFAEFGSIREKQYNQAQEGKETGVEKGKYTEQELRDMAQFSRNISSYRDNMSIIIDIMQGRTTELEGVSDEQLAKLKAQVIDVGAVFMGLHGEYANAKSELIEYGDQLSDIEAQILAMQELPAPEAPHAEQSGPAEPAAPSTTQQETPTGDASSVDPFDALTK